MPLFDLINPGHNPRPHPLRFKTREEFDKWLNDVDSNKDGVISQKELHDALKALGLHLATFRAWIARISVDRNHNKVIDINESDERKLLADHAAKHWGIIVSP